jgi:hypothetical protein
VGYAKPKYSPSFLQPKLSNTHLVLVRD